MLIFYALLSFLIPPLVGATLGNAEYSCDQMFQPVCGTDGLTYESECVFNNKAAKNKDLKIHYNGSCCPQIVCQDYKEELCDSQGVTHGNECLFSSAECILKKTKNVTIVVKYKGACDACKLECDELNLPVCDEFGETHSNLCKFDEFNCRLKIEGHPSRRIKHAGKCRKQARISSVAAGTRTSESAELRLNFPESPATAPKANVGGYGSENDCDVFASSENFSFEARPNGFADQQTDNKETEAVSYEENGYKPRTANDSRADASICSAELCTKKRDPICDSFNKTHLNRCLFDFAACKSFRQSGVRLEITHKGECRKTKLNIRREPARDCTKCVDEEVVEVCDNFNQTHRSICLFSHWNCERRKSNLEQRVLVHVGPCHSGSLLFNLNDEVCPSKCARNWRPVCDSHGTTHPNLCTFQMYNCKARKSNVAEVAFLAALHECKDVAAQSSPSPISTHNAEEKHVSDKLTTETQQPKQKLTTEASLVQASNFDCPEPHCENVRSAVCDNEGHVHRNPCLFAWARCLAAQEGRTLRILPDEYCILANCQSAKSENCTNEYDPVCGSDFITYPNFCLYQKAQCAQKKIEVLFKGECSACLVKPCPHLEPESDDDLFVCDQAGESKSKCEFDMLRCIYEKKFGYNITSAYEGRCCEKLETCPVDSKPVCDSNGKVYRNRCHFEVLRCRKEKIEKQILSTIIQEGLCQEVTTTTTETPSKENIVPFRPPNLRGENGRRRVFGVEMRGQV
ncbi:hypothetical protein L596_003378 [Steinernema carpocapsae]|uniref:Kazal-like domain-containing protein n=1 Tax=Steinernema carpocapsae TaxID=34508 RepID=A0A4U8US92_STECR|nr:hypothetical protein L596_003378 [Steinernema carpocapsae]